MATDSWVGPNGELDFGGTAGSSDANWSLGVVPNSTDDTIISTTSSLSLHIDNFSENIGGLTLGANDKIFLDDRTLTIDATGGSPIEIDGTIEVENGSLIVGENLEGSGNVEFASGPTALGSLVIEGGANVTADGTGSIEMQILAAVVTDSKIIAGSGGATFTNSSETISGDVQIGLNTDLVFINNATVQTNNSLAGGDTPGTLQITGSAGSGSFTNNASVYANNGGALIFGMDGDASTIANNLLVDLDGEGKATSLQIAGNVTVDSVASSTPGIIALGGADAGADDQVVSVGHAASLTLVNQTLKGAGTVGDTNLTLNNASGMIESTATGETLVLNTGSNTITNGAAGLITTDGGNLSIDSPVENDGTMAADNDILTLEKPVSGAGTIDIGQGSIVQALAQLSGNLAFTANNGVLELSNPFPAAEITSALSRGNLILFTSLPYSSSMHLVWQQSGSSGALSVVNSNGTLATVNIAGQYTVNDFTLFQDNGVATVNLPNSSPPAATTAEMIMTDGSGDYEIYDIGGSAVLAAYSLGQVGAPWTFVGMGTFQAGDTADMLLRNTSTGGFEAYYISNNNITNAALIGTVGMDWNFAGTGDFDGQSSLSELLLRNSASGSFELYQVAGSGVLSGSAVAAVGSNLQVSGFGNFSGSSTTQMIMEQANEAPGTNAYWLYTYNPSAAAFAGHVGGTVGNNLSVVGFGDLLGNGETQMVMQQSNGDIWLYTYNATENALSGQEVGAVGSNFHVVGFGPLGTSGQDEMLMQDAAGAFEVYQYSAGENAFVGTSMGAVGAPWEVDGIAANPSGGGASAASTAQLTQAMASFGTTAAANSAPVPALGTAEQTQQTLLTTPHA